MSIDCKQCEQCAETCPEISKRGYDWIDFSSKVVRHIEEYTVPQYGDKGSDNITEWTAEDCFKQVERYLQRRKTNQRAGQTKLDLLKMTHYIQMAYDKIDDNRNGIV